jgi:ribose 5-phosphate isomerase A
VKNRFQILPFKFNLHRSTVAGCDAVLRMGSSSTNKPDGDEIAVTDNGNYIVDLLFKEPIKDVDAAAAALKSTVGVVDHGLFVGMSYQVRLRTVN